MTIPIHASEKWNHTGFVLEPGVTYRCSATGEWVDATIVYGPDGGRSGSNLFLRLAGIFRRRPKDNWFALIGAIGEDESTTFLLGSSNPSFTPTKDGELTCYANDVSLAYSNNKGYITLTIERLG